MWLVLLCFGASFSASIAAQTKTSARKTAPNRQEVSQKRGDLRELRGQIETLRKEVAQNEGKRASAADQLKGVEQDISATQRNLYTLSQQRDKLQTTLKLLGQQARDLENRLSVQQRQLETLVHRQYLRGNPDALQVLLNGDDPHQALRDLHYLSAIGRARGEMLQEIQATLERQQSIAAATRARTEELSGVERKEKAQHEKLLAQREERKTVLDKMAARISAQRREIGNLERDEKRLAQLIDRLSKELAAKEAQRREAARQEAVRQQSARQEAVRQEQRGPGEARRAENKTAAPEISNERTPEASPAVNIARLKGSLRLPVRGAVTNRFGAARPEGGTWKGLFIRAAAGSEVKAIAAGRVVFADWMRGFGNLLIVDHGGGYLSIYGNNDALLKQVGDSLRGGEILASAGNSGGNPESGLYFELRHQGQPIDPLKWVALN